MPRQLNVSTSFPGRVAISLLLCIGLSLVSVAGALAAQPGHGRVSSVPGAPLQVSVPVKGLTADDLKVLSASIADSASWAQAGLTLPAPIETLSVSVEPGLDPSSRTLVLRSTQVVDRPVIDVLIRLKTTEGTTSIQSSYLVLTSASQAAGGRSVNVVRGDTLYAIALSKMVSGADIYQVMWAIYEANPQAFIAENMNLLRAGATLNIPDAATIRAVDAKYARSMFTRHDQTFRARRGAGQVSAAVPLVASPTTQSGSVTNQQAYPNPVQSGDQVRLDSSNPADQQADARVANANELRDMQSRVEALQKNVEELKDALQKSQALAGNSQSAGAAASANSSVQAVNPVSNANASATAAATQDPGLNAAREAKTGFAKLQQYASDHILGFVLGISALLALLIAFLLKRAGHNAQSGLTDEEPRTNPTLASDFDQKLQSIDLNLSSDDVKSSKDSASTRSGA